MRESIEEHLAVVAQLLADAGLCARLGAVAADCVQMYRNGGRLWLAGNGGSAADAQHLAAELTGRFYLDRPALFAEALHCNTSYLSAVANDYGYEQVYARLLQGCAQRGDMVWLFSTSGNSPNILLAAQAAQERGCIVVGFTGEGGGKLAPICHYLLSAHSHNTPRIQETHILMGHLLCQKIEADIFGAP